MAHNTENSNVGTTYEVRVYDYDAALDGDGYYVCARERTSSLQAARLSLLYFKQAERYTGGAIWHDGQVVDGFGLIPE